MLLSASVSKASDSLTSEFSHVASGAVMAGYITKLFPESDNRAWLGFGISSAFIVAEQNYEISKVGKRSSQQLDMAAHILGSAVGAWYCDKYLLVPLIGKNSVSLTLQIPLN